MTNGKAADLISQLESRVARLEELTSGAICPPAPPGLRPEDPSPRPCSRCVSHREGHAAFERYAHQREAAAARRAEAEQAESQFWREHPPEETVRIIFNRPTGRYEGTASVPLAWALATRLEAAGASWVGRDFRGGPVAEPFQISAGGHHLETAALWSARIAADPELAAAVESGLLVASPASHDDTMALARRRRGR